MTIKVMYCDQCDEDTEHDELEGYDHTDDDDDDLDTSGLISKMNGDIVYTYTCQKCFNQFEEI
ncbi:hypothetical protein HWV00_20875 (plasmid) [Moritella sp. 24]|uniref:hypothetical protein n=1 Tax=Moritella sp. 24 TaxID=2746230 RepID=UPI001BAD4B6C|nr:hypothetical protein [Moritella sp. 24]QUM78728.1 hypothetical protein HWV00_20875 [Moritella sp. 24]